MTEIFISLLGGAILVSLTLCGLYLVMNWKGGDE